MTTQETGSFRGDCFEHIYRIDLSTERFYKLLGSRVNNAMIPISAPKEVELNYRGRRVPIGSFRYKKKYSEQKIPPVVTKLLPIDFQYLYEGAIDSDSLYDNQSATLRILRNVCKLPDDTSYDRVLEDADKMYSESLKCSYFADIASLSKARASVYKNSQALLDFLRTAFSSNTPSTSFGNRHIVGMSNFSYVYNRDVYLFSMFGEVYAFTTSGLSVCIDCVDMFTKMTHVFCDSYPRKGTEDILIEYHNMIIDKASEVDIILTPIIGYIVHQAVSAAILEEHGVNRDIAASFFDEAEEKVSDYMNAFSLKYDKGKAKEITKELFEWVFNVSADKPFVYELSLVFRSYPAPDMSKAHILETCYGRTSKEHPYNIPDKDEYLAYCKKEIYRAYRRAKDPSITVKSFNSEIQEYLRAGKDPLALELEAWKVLNLVGEIEVPEVNSDPFSLARDSAIPYAYQEWFDSSIDTPPVECRNYLLYMAHDNEYHSKTLKTHMNEILNGERKINCNILQRVKYENVKLPNSPRVFSEAATDLRLTIAGIEHIGRRILRLMPGNAMGKTPEDFLHYVYKMSIAGEITGNLTYVSYDLSKFGTRYNTGLLTDFLGIIGDISPVRNIKNIGNLLHSGNIFIDEGDITGKYRFTTGNCEGFFNAIWTLEHIMTMSYAAYKASLDGLISGNIFLLTFSDDGASAQHVNEKDPKVAVERLATHLGKWYNSMGKSFNSVKGMINTTGFNFLNHLVAYGRVFPSGMKTVSRIKVKQNDYLQGFHEDIGSMVSAARGAVVRGADPFCAYRMLINVVNLYMNRYMDGFRKAKYNDKKYFIFFPKSHYGAGILDVIELLGTLIKDREVDGMELCRRMAGECSDCEYLATLTLDPVEKNIRTLVANPRSINRKGIHSYLPAIHALLRDSIKGSNLCSSIKAYVNADIDIEPYLNWVPDAGAVPVRILEEYWDATPSAVLSSFLGKLRNRHSYLSLIDIRSLTRIRKNITFYRKKKFQGFINKRMIGGIAGSTFEVVESLRKKANRGLHIEGATEPSVYSLIIIEPGEKGDSNVTISCSITEGTYTDDLSNAYMPSGLYYKLGRSIKNSLSTGTDDPYLPIETFEEVRGNLATAARAVRRVSASACLTQENRKALVISLADWWGYKGTHVIQDEGHNFDYNQYKRYCISATNLGSTISVLPNISCAIHTTFPSLANIRTLPEELVDHGRARVLMAGIFASLIGKRIKFGITNKKSSYCIYSTAIGRKVDLDLLKSTNFTYRRTESYSLMPFNPFDVEMSYKNFFDPDMRQHIGSREMVPLAVCVTPSEDVGGIVIEYKSRTGMLAPVSGTSVRSDNRPVLAAAALICYSPRAAYDWNMVHPPVDQIPSKATLAAYYRKALGEYSNADIVEYLKDSLGGNDVPNLLADWTIKEGIGTSWTSVLNWIRIGRHGFLRDARNLDEALNNLATAGRVVYDLVGLIRECVRLICLTLKEDPRNIESANSSVYGYNEAVSIEHIRDRHGYMQLFCEVRNKRTAKLAVLSIIDEVAYVHGKKNYRRHGFTESYVYAIRKATRVATSVVARFIKAKDVRYLSRDAVSKISDTIVYHATKRIIDRCAEIAFDWTISGDTFLGQKKSDALLNEVFKYTNEIVLEMYPATYENCIRELSKVTIFECKPSIQVDLKRIKGLCLALGDRSGIAANCIARDICKYKGVYHTYLFDDLLNTKFHVGDPAILVPAGRRILETEKTFRWATIAAIYDRLADEELLTYEDIAALKKRILRLPEERITSMDTALGNFLSKNPIATLPIANVNALAAKINNVINETQQGIVRK